MEPGTPDLPSCDAGLPENEWILKIAVAHPCLGRGGSEARAMYGLDSLLSRWSHKAFPASRVEVTNYFEKARAPVSSAEVALPDSVALAHPSLGQGGSEAGVCWGLSSLQNTPEVTLLTGGDVELDALNRYYGTCLQAHDFRVLQPSRFAWRTIGRTDALRGAVFQRFCQSVADQFDVLISCYNFVDFGRPAIQFLADFSFDDELRRTYDPPYPGIRGWAHRAGPHRRAYLAFARMIARRTAYDGRADLIVANSQWTADVLRNKRAVNVSKVVYPPVSSEAPVVPWEQKELGFAVLGRVSPEKRIERVIDILVKVRALGHDVHLHVIGPIGADAYGRLVRRKINENRTWVFAEGRLDGEKKMAMLAAHRYGIHGRNAEAFGIVVAEMIKAECIPFVPADGGQMEIVNHPLLAYSNIDDAVQKIHQVLCDDSLQRVLRDHLTKQSEKFSADRFVADFRAVVDEFVTGLLARPGSSQAKGAT